MIRIEARAIGKPIAAVVPVVVAAAAIALAAMAFAVAAYWLGKSFSPATAAAFQSQSALMETLARAAPLALTGLAAALAFRISLYNLGGEGQFLAGALAAIAVVGGAAAAPAWTKYPLLLAAGATAGAALMFVPAALKIKRGTDEAIVTLLLNFIMLMGFQGALKHMPAGWSGTVQTFAATVDVNTGPLVALAAAVVLFVVLRYTIWGLQVRAVEANAAGARFVGVRTGRATVLVGMISGALAGLGGAVAVASGQAVLAHDMYAGLGYAGIAVAVLAGRAIAGVVAVAVVMAGVLVEAGAFAGAAIAESSADIFIAVVLAAGLVGIGLVRYRVAVARAGS